MEVMKEIKLTDGRELLVVEVPENLNDYEYSAGMLTGHTYNWFNTKLSRSFNLPEGNFILLGEVTRGGKVSFDTYDFVRKPDDENNAGFFHYTAKSYQLGTPQKSFLSLLESKGITIPESKKLIVLLKQ